jgi:hypothetical protein
MDADEIRHLFKGRPHRTEPLPDGRRRVKDHRGRLRAEYLLPVAGDGAEIDPRPADYAALDFAARVPGSFDAQDMLYELEEFPNLPAVFEDHTRAALVAEIDAAIGDLRRVREALAAPVRECEVCGARFTGRADARTCSASCRQRAHRARQRQRSR